MIQTELFTNFLNSIAYYYYPKNLHESDIEYMTTEEHKKYLGLHSSWSHFKNGITPLVTKIREEAEIMSIIVNGTANNTPCYEIELLQKSDEKRIVAIVIYISMFIPFYHVSLLEKSRTDNTISTSFDIPSNFEQKISRILRDFLNYNRFPSELIKNKIPMLEVNSNFDYLKAFFTDCYRIAHN